ncbi:hypothetical protein ACLM5J_03245 [Nocardioides sp. Bht2]|uniref:hypothetical protein n=1 Tax=Nocardioides sp. Bht2 TaxID=3392297 RepID=UPI0039B6A5FB
MRNRSLRHLMLSIVLSIALLATALVASPWRMTGGDTLRDIYEAQSKEVAAEALGLALDGHNHRHDDPATKNTITRAGETEGTADPTTAVAARRNTSYAASQRKLRDPKLTRTSLRSARKTIPENRYAVAGGCYRLGNTATRFQATDLGINLLYSPQRTFLTASGNNTASWAAKPSASAEWSTRRSSKGFAFVTGTDTWLRYAGGTFSTGAEPTFFALRTTTGCAVYPEVDTNVSGNPHAGVSSFQEVRGYIDPHVHGMSFEFLGGEVHCGRPWHKYGAPYALPDCSDLSQQGTKGGVLDLALSGGTRDPIGWPTFKGWPKPDALTHEGVYYKWLERAWRGGQRIMVNLLVENGQLCNLYPAKRNSCNDMDSARLQAKRMRELERYIDAQYGGPGKGWYRIVTDPFQARKVINQGKLAIIMGVEVSIPFGCTMKLDIAACDIKQIRSGLNELYGLGVRQMELVNKFDNALAGVAGDEGGIGPLVNLANFLETGSFWSMGACDPKAGDSTDKAQLGVPDLTGGQAQDALFGAVAKLGLSLPALPIYPSGSHCNRRGLTDLGVNVLEQMVGKKMLIDPDHMSVKARTATLDLLERKRYSGVVSSHSWSTPDAYPRIYNMGGFVAPMAGDATGFVEKWKRHLTWANKRYYFGFGFGADINGLAQQAMPRGAKVKNKVTYPVTGFNGVRVDRQRSGSRQFDINTDGVAHYGLYPDWIADLTKVSGSTAINDDMIRGAEAYLQTWERAHGVRADSCRNPELRKPLKKVRKLLKRGMTTNAVMTAVGQPYERLGTSYTFCAKKPVRNRAGKVVRWKKVTVAANFTKRGKLRTVRG